MVDYLNSVEDLEELYGAPSKGSLIKVADHLTPTYRKWIEASRFCVLSTVGPEGTDGTPRGDDGPVVAILDPQTLALPDWRGNNRIDSLHNIVRDPRVSIMFMVPGSTNVVRVNGEARVTADDAMRALFVKEDKQPQTVTVIRIHEIYVQCAKAVMRSRLWTAGDESADLPSIGDMLKEMSAGEIGGETYDKEWPDRAKSTMW